MAKLSKQQLIIVGGIAGVLIALLLLVFFSIRSQKASAPFTIKIWGFDDKDTISPFISSYKAIHTFATIEYDEVDPGSYQKALLSALAAGNGPDIFYIGNRELPKQKDLISPVDPAQFPNFNLIRFRELFPTAVEQDFVLGGRIYAAPLYLDTIALIYNRDLFDRAGIVSPPKTWDEFQGDVQKAKLVNPQGQITRAAAAIGGTEKTVDAGIDLLHLLMLQNGTKMVKGDLSEATFAAADSSGGDPGNAAFNFYLQFANAGSPYYTWNDGQPDSLDSFASGKTVMIFNYHSALDVIKNKSPFLNIGVTQVPQPSAEGAQTTYPKYYGLTVSKQSKNPYWAWDFALYLTSSVENGKIYFEKTGAPPALRGLIQEKLSDPDYGVFAKQALTARSWYEADDVEVEKIFNNAIQSVLNGQTDSATALRRAEDEVSQLMAKTNNR